MEGTIKAGKADIDGYGYGKVAYHIVCSIQFFVLTTHHNTLVI